jgi:proteasome lid subunit RPN8/RPN11
VSTEELGLTPTARRRMLEHARSVLPLEAVGLLGGPPSGPASTAIPLPNLVGRGAYLADPFAQFQAERALVREGLEVLAVYHSHPDGDATPSRADLALAVRLSVIQVIIALAVHRRAGVRGYRIGAEGIEEVDIRPA